MHNLLLVPKGDQHMARKRICLMQVPPFNPSSAMGGSEVVAIYIAQALAADNAVTVLHGFPAEPQEYRGPDFPAEILPAFPFDYQDFDHTGHVTPAFTPTAQRKIAEADVIVSIETSLNLPVSAARVVFLGGVNGPHTHDIVQHRCWDRLVVPSDFAARQVDPGWQPFDASYREVVTNDPSITVIESAVDTDLFRSDDSRGRYAKPVGSGLRLLYPHRPTLNKGFPRAVELVKALEKKGHRATLVVFDQSDGYTPEGLKQPAAESNCDVEILPWQPRSAMPGIYQTADLTLCLGSHVEGFGLTAPESVACGTPALSHGAGFLKEMLPAGHGLFYVDPAADPEFLAECALEAVDVGRDQCLEYGRPYIGRRYSVDRMNREFAELVSEI